ncbi:MAG: mercuric reductase [Planctomycetota bacterium]
MSVSIPALEPHSGHNLELARQVHPSSWVNPKPKTLYHLVVVGAGPAGLVAAAGAASLGARVALVEKHLMGGDCLNVGCVPSKAMIRSARAVTDVRRASDFGIITPEPQIDFGAVMERMRRLRASLSPHDSVARFTSLGVDVFLGEGRFAGDRHVEVEGASLCFSKALIATGARAAIPPIAGLQEVGFLTNETIFSLTELPRRLVVIGGGPIGAELAQSFARFGSSVTLVEGGPQMLGREDPDAAACIGESLKKDGVGIHVNASVVEVRKGQGCSNVMIRQGGSLKEIPADRILLSVGRRPNIESLALERAGVTADPLKGVSVNDRLQTSNPRIYAAGDVCSPYKFTHAADAMARIVLQNALFMGRARASTLTIPWCTYTDPEVAHVGMYAHEAQARNLPVETLRVDLKDLDRAALDGDGDGFLKIHFHRKRGTIFGATLVARHAGEMISEISALMTSGGTMGTLANTVHPYPTQAEVFKRAGDAFNRRRLTPFVKQLMSLLLKRLG